MKTKPKSCFQVVNVSTDEVTKRECVFQLDELVDPYRVAQSIELKED